MATRVVHIKGHAPGDDADIYVGRWMKKYPELRVSGWGNRFHKYNSSDPIRDYFNDLLGDFRMLRRLHELRGKRLGCWCAGRSGLDATLDLDKAICHGQVLAALADGPLGDPDASREQKNAYWRELRQR